MANGQARLKDMAKIPACAHGCTACPHPSPTGPALRGSKDVLVNTLPAVRDTDGGCHAACCNTNLWTANGGSATVKINGLKAFRQMDPTKHCATGTPGMMTGPCSTNVLVGG